MKAKEYYNSTRVVETRNWTLDMAMNFAEEYYEERTKALTIQRVSKCTICKKGFTKEHNMDRMCQSCCTKAYYDK